MVRVAIHGGGCCGARHIHGFTALENRDPDRINAVLKQVPPGRMVEVILNGNQVSSFPNILERLANLGFVLDGHWINSNHRSHNYRFSRCDDRLPLNLDGWNGMVMNSGLQGRLPEVPHIRQPHILQDDNIVNHTPYIKALPPWQISDATIRHLYLYQLQETNVNGRIGVRYRINSPHSRYHNREFIAVSRGGGNDRNNTLFFRDNETGNRLEITLNNCVRIDEDPVEVPAGSNMREYVVGDRVQVVCLWNEYAPGGLVGTVTQIFSPTRVLVQFDTPNTLPKSTSTRYITIVDFDRQPDVPRTRPEAPPPPPVAERPVEPPQRHEEGQAPRNHPAEPVQPRVILSTYHNVFRDGRRGAGYDTFNEAWENRGRRTSVDRRQVMSNGDIIWNVNVLDD